MQVYAVATWCIYTALLIHVGWRGLSQARLALVAFSVILLVTSALRQPLYFLRLDRPHPRAHFEATEWELLCVANLALIGWVCVVVISYSLYAAPARLMIGAFPRRCVSGGAGAAPRGVFVAVLAPFALSVLGTLYLIVQSGGLAQFTFDVKVGKDLAGLYVIRAAGALASMLAFYGVLASMRRSPGGGVRLTAMAWLYLLMVVVAMAANFAWGNRYSITLIALGFLVGFHLYVRPLRILEVLGIGVLAVAGLQGLKLLRLALISEAVGADLAANENTWLSLSLSLHLVEFDALMLALRDAGSLFDFRWGADFYNGLVAFVPRFVLPSKETFHVGGWFRRIYEPWTVNGWPITTPGSWYVNFGPVGILLGGWVSGVVMRAYDEAFGRARLNAWHAAIGSSLAFFLFEAGVNTGFVQYYVLYAVPMFLASIWILLLSGGGRAPPPAHLPGVPSARGAQGAAP